MAKRVRRVVFHHTFHYSPIATMIKIATNSCITNDDHQHQIYSLILPPGQGSGAVTADATSCAATAASSASTTTGRPGPGMNSRRESFVNDESERYQTLKL